jgi:hypothetical protein
MKPNRHIREIIQEAAASEEDTAIEAVSLSTPQTGGREVDSRTTICQTKRFLCSALSQLCSDIQQRILEASDRTAGRHNEVAFCFCSVLNVIVHKLRAECGNTEWDG